MNRINTNIIPYQILWCSLSFLDFPERNISNLKKTGKHKNQQYSTNSKTSGNPQKSLVDQSEGAQRCKTSLPVTTKSQGGSGGGVGGWVGVLGPCQWRPYSFWLPWINLLAGELWGEGRSGGISSVALLWLSAELSARTHTQNAARHTINTYIHTHTTGTQSRAWETRVVSQHTCQSLQSNTHTSLDGRQRKRADKNRKRGIKHLSTFPTFHFLLIVGGVALCWSLESRQTNRKTLKLTQPASSPTGLRARRLGGARCSGFQTKQNTRLTLTPSGGLCTTVLWDSCDAEQKS